MFFSHCRSTRAFTLIELLIVVAIIGILAAIAIPNFLQAQIRAKVATAQADLRTLAQAMEQYRIDNNIYAYPTSRGAGLSLSLPRSEEIKMIANRTSPFLYGMFAEELTTPVDYISSLPEDYFKLAGFGVTGPSQLKFPPGHPWRRYNMGSRDSGALWLFTNDIRPEWRNKEWVAASLGPDRQEDIFSPWTLVEYDPTNGTMSRGDISRSGP